MAAEALPQAMPEVRGKLTPDAPLAKLVWFKTGGCADWLFEPADADDLSDFLHGQFLVIIKREYELFFLRKGVD